MKRADTNAIRRVRAHIVKRGMKPQEGDGTVAAYVNHGRWVANCPCGGAELITEDQDMLCGSCAHIRQVVWPANVEVIESMLEARQYQQNQNWNPGETVDQLASEVF